MPVPESKTLIIVPCYNEEDRFPVHKFLNFNQPAKEYAFLLVDDGSTDRTHKIISDLEAKNPDQFSVLKLDQNCGKAEAVRQGFLHSFDSNAQFLAYWDADLATPLEILPSFMNIFNLQADIEIVLGSRVKLMGRDIRRKTYRHYLGRVFATCASLVLNLSVYDTQCGAKMFRKTETLKNIFTDPFRSRWIFDVELLARYLKEKQVDSLAAEQLIYELPLPEWHDIAGSKVKPADFFLALSELVQIYLAYR